MPPWSALHQTRLASGGDGIIDTSTDQLTGGSGADWFIVNRLGDSITDTNLKQGDVIEFVG